jgi:hypothetical protein
MATNPKDEIVAVKGDFSQLDPDLAAEHVASEFEAAAATILEAIEGLDPARLATPAPQQLPLSDPEMLGIRTEAEPKTDEEADLKELRAYTTHLAMEMLGDHTREWFHRQPEAKRQLCELLKIPDSYGAVQVRECLEALAHKLNLQGSVNPTELLEHYRMYLTSGGRPIAIGSSAEGLSSSRSPLGCSDNSGQQERQFRLESPPTSSVFPQFFDDRHREHWNMFEHLKLHDNFKVDSWLLEHKGEFSKTTFYEYRKGNIEGVIDTKLRQRIEQAIRISHEEFFPEDRVRTPDSN